MEELTGRSRTFYIKQITCIVKPENLKTFNPLAPAVH